VHIIKVIVSLANARLNCYNIFNRI